MKLQHSNYDNTQKTKNTKNLIVKQPKNLNGVVAKENQIVTVLKNLISVQAQKLNF